MAAVYSDNSTVKNMMTADPTSFAFILWRSLLEKRLDAFKSIFGWNHLLIQK